MLGVVWQLADGEARNTVHAAIERYRTLVERGRLDDARELFRYRLEDATSYRLAAHRERIGMLERLLPDDMDKLPALENELDWGIHGRVQPGPANASIFDVENGMSIADDMEEPVRIGETLYQGIDWDPADKAPGSRKQGWEQPRKRPAIAYRQGRKPREYPGLFIFRYRCPHVLHTVPTLPRNDQALDEVR